jgi:AcrR family transcriptional regulator
VIRLEFNLNSVNFTRYSSFMVDTYHHGNLRQALLDEAIRAVRAGQADTFSLRATAKSLGISPAAVYHHFADKNALMNAVIRETGLLLHARLVSASTPPPPPGDQAMRLGLAYIDFAIDEPALFVQLTSTTCLESRDVQGMSLEMVAHALEVDARGEELTDTILRERVWASWALSHGFASLTIAGRISPSDARQAFIRQCHPEN